MAEIVLAKGSGWGGREISLTAAVQVVDFGRSVRFFKLIHKTGDEVFISTNPEVVADADKYPYILATESYVYENRSPGEEIRRISLVCSAAETATVRLEL